ncbi:MAG: glycerol-3-phosphate responsive antiterminator [Gudongella sp.]|nr:glycerol-3-phosphate responsive antiterminator [Gudongella sp.]
MSLLYESLSLYPIIAEVNLAKEFESALNSVCQNIFLMQSNIFTIKELSIKAKQKNKNLFIFIDSIEGYIKNSWGIEFIIKNIALDGIISSNNNILKQSKEMGVFSLGYYPIYNEYSIENALNEIKDTRPHGIILLPGVLTDTISIFSKKINVPIIVSGLIDSPDLIKNALKAGAIGACTEKFYAIDI